MPRYEVTFKRIETIEHIYKEIITEADYDDAKAVAEDMATDLPPDVFERFDDDSETLVEHVEELTEEEEDEEEEELDDDEEI